MWGEGRLHSFRLAAHSHEEVRAIGAAIFGNGRELLTMPLDDDSGADVEGSLDTNARSGERSIFHCGHNMIGRAAGVFPKNFGDRPHHRSRLKFPHVHVICIGGSEGEFSRP